MRLTCECNFALNGRNTVRITYSSTGQDINSPLNQHYGLGVLFKVCAVCYRPSRTTFNLPVLWKRQCPNCWELFSSPVGEEFCKSCHLELLATAGVLPGADPYVSWRALRRKLSEIRPGPESEPYRLTKPVHVYQLTSQSVPKLAQEKLTRL